MMNKYLAHVEYEVLYSGKRLHSMTQDVVVDTASYCYSNGEEWDVVEFKFETTGHVKSDEGLELDAHIDICNDNNQFIMSTHMKKKMKEKSRLFYDSEVGIAIYETSIRIYVPVKETKNED